jgi:hypothetical protein
VGEVAMRAALPEVRKWVQSSVEPAFDDKARIATVRPAPMPAD